MGMTRFQKSWGIRKLGTCGLLCKYVLNNHRCPHSLMIYFFVFLAYNVAIPRERGCFIWKWKECGSLTL